MFTYMICFERSKIANMPTEGFPNYGPGERDHNRGNLVSVEMMSVAWALRDETMLPTPGIGGKGF